MHSNSGNIFLPEISEELRRRQFVLTLRRPIDRLESEFYF